VLAKIKKRKAKNNGKQETGEGGGRHVIRTRERFTEYMLYASEPIQNDLNLFDVKPRMLSGVGNRER